MKCPECGFVSYPGPAECKKCGYRFRAAADGAAAGQADAERAFPIRRPLPGSAGVAYPAASRHPSSLLDAAAPEPPGTYAPEFPVSHAAWERQDSSEPLESQAEPAAATAFRPPPWKDELAERVARYKRRRSRVRPGTTGARANLEFDFSEQAALAGADGGELDVDLNPRTPARAPAPLLESVALDRRPGGATIHDEVAMEWTLEPRDDEEPGPSEPEPLEIVLESGQEEEEASSAGEHPPPRLAASLARRFAAGLADGLVLSFAASVFVIVFLLSGGRIPGHPSRLMEIIGALTAAFFVVFYFALFSAVTSATPGQSALGLRVRTLDGGRPDWPAARRRAVGYLVSAAALGLGFAWAVFDGDGLTWHDRMSGTCLAAVPGPHGTV